MDETADGHGADEGHGPTGAEGHGATGADEGHGAAGAADVVRRVLESVGRPSEARYYLDLFRGGPPERFAALVVEPGIAEDSIDAVVLDVALLAQVGLRPSVYIGWFDPVGAERLAERVARRLAGAGVTVARSGGSGAATSVATEIRDALRSGAVPLVVSDGDGRADDPVERFVEVLGELAVGKVLFLEERGGLHDGDVLVPLVDLATDAGVLAATLVEREAVLLDRAERLIERVPQRLLVAIAAPLNLFRELFTVRGAGTLVRAGFGIVQRSGWDGPSREHARRLLVDAFGREPSADFFERPVSAVHHEIGWRGAAVLLDVPERGTYLSKFAVARDAQGEGLARDIWRSMTAQRRRIFWRARRSNPITAWYERMADGLVRGPEWTVYWTGSDPDAIPALVQDALSRPDDFT